MKNERKNIFDFFDESTKNETPGSVLFCGMKSSGKTSLIERFINKNVTDIPKPTIGVEYKYVRQQDIISKKKTVIEIYDICIDIIDFIYIPKNIISIIIVLDMSSPDDIIDKLNFFIKYIYKINIKKNNNKWDDHIDKNIIKIPPVDIVIIASKWDIFENFDTEKRKYIYRSLRYYSHIYGATVISNSIYDKLLMNNMRLLLKYILFSSEKLPIICKDEMKYICILSSYDKISDMKKIDSLDKKYIKKKIIKNDENEEVDNEYIVDIAVEEKKESILRQINK
eukprot:GHVL01039867.1.p2 GENE.GHVL01039867.1~~GHVL01039867.1.p2  ORF type:complete len:282 (+),score=114.44 GHVL01039867.1:1032-1877(+)